MEKIHMFFRGQTVKVTLPLQAASVVQPSHTMGKASMLKPGMAAAILTGHTLLTKALMTILFRAKTTMASTRKAEVEKVYQGARVGRAQLALAHSTPEDSTEHTLC